MFSNVLFRTYINYSLIPLYTHIHTEKESKAASAAVQEEEDEDEKEDEDQDLRGLNLKRLAEG
jgi:hypothetical protein